LIGGTCKYSNVFSEAVLMVEGLTIVWYGELGVLIVLFNFNQIVKKVFW
jgi:hypothetical protein